MTTQRTLVVLNHDFLLDVLRDQQAVASRLGKCDAAVANPIVSRALAVCHTLAVNRDILNGYRRAIPLGATIPLGPLVQFRVTLRAAGLKHKFIESRARSPVVGIPGLKAKHREIVLGAAAIGATYLVARWQPGRELAHRLATEYRLEVITPERYAGLLGL